MDELHTRGPDGQRHTFYWSVDDPEPYESEQRWIFRVRRTDPPDPAEEFYEAVVTELDQDTVYTDVLDNHGARWARRKGISEALFRVIHDRLRRRIVSSRSYVADEAEWQSPFARRMWERFRANGLARFDPESGRYIYMPPTA